MGVHGLWRLIEPSGKPVPLETLENKVLAVDVSIWLHQAIKGFQDTKGAPLPNAHLLGIYHRVCKLLYFKVKPVFVFDGGVPVLKKETIAKRNQAKSRNINEADRIQKQLLSTLLKHSAITNVLSERTRAALQTTTKISPTKKQDDEKDNMYVLPPTEMDTTFSSSDEETDFESTSETTDSSPTKYWDLHTIDMNSVHFKSLPVDVRHEILTDLKETRKQSSWGKIHELPRQSDDFSVYQMNRLLKRQAVQTALEDAEKEMGGHSLSLGQLESLLKDQGVITSDKIGSRIASDENTRFLLIKDMKLAIETAKKEQMVLETVMEEKDDDKIDIKVVTNTESSDVKNEISDENVSELENTTIKSEESVKTKADLEYEEDLAKAIALSLQEEPSTSKSDKELHSKLENTKKKLQFSFLENFSDADFGSESSGDDLEEVEKVAKETLSSAQSYMMEYSGLTPAEIQKIINSNASKNTTNKIKGKQIIRNKQEEQSIADSKVVQKLPHVNLATNIDIEEKVNSDVQNDNKIEDVEIMSESGESSSSDDFLEVKDGENDKPKDDGKNAIEVVIKPTEELEDDLFSDIFENKSDIVTDPKSPEIVINKSSKKEDSFDDVLKPAVKEIIGDIKENIMIPESKEVKIDEKNEEVIKEIPNEETVIHVNEKVEKLGNTIEENKMEVDKPREEFVKPTLTVAQMNELKNDLKREQIELTVEKSTKERLASNITDQMYQEAQELLELFGVPYIIAPMEAEAQCAFLDEINLTDGTITDDSDIWLFGGKTVYKNFFNQAKHVMEFKAENIKHHFKLSREQMILLALLVGSDYTTGIQGVGPVTALEILAAFPFSKNNEITISQAQLISGLKDFKNWINKGKTPARGKMALKNKLKNVSFTENFPSLQVVQAYLEPTVETSKEKFSWGKPDTVGLVDFAREKFGWTRKKAEEILNPVLKKLEENRVQKSIKEFFRTKHKIDSGNVENKISKRVKIALDRIGKDPEEIDEENDKEKEKPKRGRRKKTEETEKEKEKPKRGRKKKPVESDLKSKELEEMKDDEDVMILKQIEEMSKIRVEEINQEVSTEIDKTVSKGQSRIHNEGVSHDKQKTNGDINKNKRMLHNFHKKEIIHQKERDKSEMMRSKLKAIEVYRKSKQGPGFVKKREKLKRLPKKDAGLSESSDDD